MNEDKIIIIINKYNILYYCIVIINKNVKPILCSYVILKKKGSRLNMGDGPVVLQYNNTINIVINITIR